MKVNIYYGGRGVLDDPTLHVINKMEQVLRELNVEVHRYNIYENKHEISTMPNTLKGSDGIILATTVEWLGIGGFMQQFLDACWLYGDKESISGIYMQPVVMSTTYGEKEGMLTLENAWEILGGLPCSGICGYVENIAAFEDNNEFSRIIENKTENLYRTISKKMKGLPTSNQAVKRSVLHTRHLDLTPQESEQLSQYVADDKYVKQQKDDIEELSAMFKSMMGGTVEETPETEYISSFRAHYRPQSDFRATYSIMIDGKPHPLFIGVNGSEIRCEYADTPADISARVSGDIMDDIVNGRMTFTRAFGTGAMTARGNLRVLRMLDTIFMFS